MFKKNYIILGYFTNYDYDKKLHKFKINVAFYPWFVNTEQIEYQIIKDFGFDEVEIVRIIELRKFETEHDYKEEIDRFIQIEQGV